MMRLGKLLHILTELVYPRRAVCMGCGSRLGMDRDDLCEACRVALETRRVGPVPPAGQSSMDACAFAYGYAGTAGSIVRNLKYGSVKVLAERMSEDIARELKLLHLSGIDAVTCVPMHPRRLRQRGFNHAELLARGVAAELGLEYRELLYRTRYVQQQARLERSERKKNLREAFAVRRESAEWLRGRRILLVDDVMTTGTTADECARTLKRAGAEYVCFGAFALSEGKK